MPRGRAPTAEEEQLQAAILDAADPTKQRATIDARATWVFSSVGAVATVLGGFSIFVAERPLFELAPVAGVAVFLLIVVALVAAGSTLVLSVRRVRLDDPEAAKRYFEKTMPRRRLGIQVAVITLILAILVAGSSGLFTYTSRDASAASVEWTTGADDRTVSIAVSLDDVDESDTITVELVATDAGGEEAVRFAAAARSDQDGKVELDSDVVLDPADVTAELQIERNTDRVDSIPIALPPPAAEEDDGPSTVDDVVEATNQSLLRFWTEALAAEDVDLSAPTLRSYDTERGSPPLTCGEMFDAEGAADNAYFCSEGPFIAFDRVLMRRIHPNHGAYAVAVVIAHEWGHLVQSALDPASHLSETQADCFAGAWARAEEADDDSTLGLVEDDRDSGAVALTFEDDGDPEAEDRVDAFRDGLTNGVEACMAYG